MLGQQWNRSWLCVPALLPWSAPFVLFLHRLDWFPLWNVSWGSPISYFYSRFGSHWVPRRFYLLGCITNTFHALFSPHSCLERERSCFCIDPHECGWPSSSRSCNSPWIAEDPAELHKPCTSACVCWCVCLIRQHPANNCTASTSAKLCF